MRVVVPISPQTLSIPLASDLVALVMKESGARVNNTARRDLLAALTHELESFIHFNWPIVYKTGARSAVIVDPVSAESFAILTYGAGERRYNMKQEQESQERVQQAVLHYLSGLASDSKRRE
jgi:hypothetical protein